MQTAMTLLWQEQKKPSGSTNWCREILDASIEAINAEWQEYFNNTPYLPEEIPDLEQIRWDAVDVFTQAFWEFDINKYEVLSVYKNGVEMPALELHFMVPCAGSKGLHGYIDAILKDKNTFDKLTFIEVLVRKGARKDLGRPKTTPQENKKAMMEFLK